MAAWIAAYEKKKIKKNANSRDNGNDSHLNRAWDRMSRLSKIRDTDNYKTAGGNLNLLADTAEEITKETGKAIVAGTVGAGLGLGSSNRFPIRQKVRNQQAKATGNHYKPAAFCSA